MRAISRFRSNGLVANSQAFHNARVEAPQRGEIDGTRVYLVNLGFEPCLDQAAGVRHSKTVPHV
jgi:hypothetical protein